LWLPYVDLRMQQGVMLRATHVPTGCGCARRVCFRYRPRRADKRVADSVISYRNV
jgi:hypothetical protein